MLVRTTPFTYTYVGMIAGLKDVSRVEWAISSHAFINLNHLGRCEGGGRVKDVRACQCIFMAELERRP